MKGQSRREFIRSCLYLALSGLASCFFPPFARRRRKEEPASAPGAPGGPRAAGGPDFEPDYLKLHKSGELRKRGEELWKMMRTCKLCPRECGARRLDGQEGFCQASSQLEISSYNPHFGEERPLVGKGGSGTIFFTNCSLRCVFCINWEISQEGQGSRRSIDDLSEMMLRLQRMGCHNINLVTPTHYSPHILLALDKAAAGGLTLPVVYNTCGWERMEILKKLDGVVDIYLPDFKYSSGKMAAKYSSDAKVYPAVTKAALLEMHRQVGAARPARDGLMYRGLMIRHLVMPNGVGGTKGVVEWIAQNLSKDSYLNIMSQYVPKYKAFNYPEIARRITREEYAEAIRWAKEAGLTNLDIQG